jgi:ketosteroid isomerase-like protein
MDDVYGINVAKTEFRDAYGSGDVNRLMAVFNPNGFTDMPEGSPTKYGGEALSSFRDQAVDLFAEYSVKLSPIVNRIVSLGSTAYDYGWHEFTLTPKNGGAPIRRRQRYFELWNKDSAGDWKISLFINNADVREELNGFKSSWFLSVEHTEAASA